MKTLILATLAMASASTMANDVKPSRYKLVGDMDYSSFCKAVLQDDVALLKTSLIRKVGVVASSRKDVLRKILSPQDGMTCAGSNLMDFAKTRQADDVYAFLVQQS